MQTAGNVRGTRTGNVLIRLGIKHSQYSKGKNPPVGKEKEEAQNARNEMIVS